jgi:MYXO-CTERM domain-containing protein
MSILIVLFCGFFVAGSDKQLVNDATQVVMMRKGTRTVLAMENSYQGPADAFAMVVPVPVVLHEGDVKTLTKDVFAHVEQMGAPRLVEYWEQDPCSPPVPEEEKTRQIAQKSGVLYDLSAGDDKDLGVKIEAKFTVGEYQILILSAKDSTGLDTWLRQNKYNIPAGAEPLLRPYVENGSKFFVAKVDPQKVKFEDGHAVLSPLRFHYDADDFSLPVRLGMANSPGKQDLIVNILAPNQRYRVANYPNATIPTNLDVKDSVKTRFGEFYAALFDATLARNPRAVVTEYAWQATTCDPCPGPTLDPSEFLTLGADVLVGSRDKPQPYDGADFVLTRLHARYGQDLANDLIFEQAKPIVGGREILGPNHELEHGAQPADTNNFQARYAIRHKWDGPIKCEHPVRGIWGGNPNPQPALDLAHVPRGNLDLAASVVGTIPELSVVANLAAAAAPPAPTPPSVPTPTSSDKKKTGCGCGTSDPAGLAGILAVVTLAIRRPSRRRKRLHPS